MKLLNKLGAFFVLIVGLLSMFGSQTTSTSNRPQPRFTSFSVAPQSVCLNQGIPLVQVSYEFDPDGWNNENTLCTTIYANDDVVHPTIRHQCLDDGTSGSYTFNLTQHFGTNVPPTVSVRVELTPLVSGTEHDSRESSLTTIVDCPPPIPMP